MSHLETGQEGESYAKEFLEKKGYVILETNYRASHAEVDIIAQHDECIIFVEVKTRAYDYYGRPEEFVTTKKQELISFAANRYMEEQNYTWEIRFDIIAIIMTGGIVRNINHFEDAFFPGI